MTVKSSSSHSASDFTVLSAVSSVSQELEDKREEYRATQTALEAAEREQAPLLAGLAARGTLQRDETRFVRTAAEAAARALRLEEEEVAEEERSVRAKVEVFDLANNSARRLKAVMRDSRIIRELSRGGRGATVVTYNIRLLFMRFLVDSQFVRCRPFNSTCDPFASSQAPCLAAYSPVVVLSAFRPPLSAAHTTPDPPEVTNATTPPVTLTSLWRRRRRRRRQTSWTRQSYGAQSRRRRSKWLLCTRRRRSRQYWQYRLLQLPLGLLLGRVW